jgi:hypothetical protein
MDWHCASFEASLREAPQDEEMFLMPSKIYLILRSVRPSTPLCGGAQGEGTRLEGRRAPLQPILE